MGQLPTLSAILLLLFSLPVLSQESRDALYLFDAFKVARASVEEMRNLSADDMEAIRQKSQGLLNQIRSEQFLAYTGYQPVLTATYALLEWNEAAQLNDLKGMIKARKGIYDAGKQLCQESDRMQEEFLAKERGFDGEVLVRLHSSMDYRLGERQEREMLYLYDQESRGKNVEEQIIMDLYSLGLVPTFETRMLTGAWLTIKALRSGDCETGLKGLFDFYAVLEQQRHNNFKAFLPRIAATYPPCEAKRPMRYLSPNATPTFPRKDSLLEMGLSLMQSQCGISPAEFAERYRNRIVWDESALQSSADQLKVSGPPALKLPLPHPSARDLLDRDFFHGANNLGEVGNRLEAALDRCGYHDLSYFEIAENGFALITRLERIDEEARPKPEPERWDASMRPNSNFGLLNYIKALFYAPEGRFRVLVFAVTPLHRLTSESSGITPQDIQGMASRGSLTLGNLAKLPFTPRHNVVALVYEFKVRKGQEPNIAQPSNFQGQTHLERTRLLQFLGE